MFNFFNLPNDILVIIFEYEGYNVNIITNVVRQIKNIVKAKGTLDLGINIWNRSRNNIFNDEINIVYKPIGYIDNISKWILQNRLKYDGINKDTCVKIQYINKPKYECICYKHSNLFYENLLEKKIGFVPNLDKIKISNKDTLFIKSNNNGFCCKLYITN
jgi:hypothetical protein